MDDESEMVDSVKDRIPILSLMNPRTTQVIEGGEVGFLRLLQELLACGEEEFDYLTQNVKADFQAFLYESGLGEGYFEAIYDSAKQDSEGTGFVSDEDLLWCAWGEYRLEYINNLCENREELCLREAKVSKDEKTA
jgi:hypothetical protein